MLADQRIDPMILATDLRLGITTALTVPLMTWVVMPRVTRLLHRWLYPDHAATRHFP